MNACGDGILGPWMRPLALALAVAAGAAAAGVVGIIGGCAGDPASGQELTVNDFRSAAPTPQPASPPESTVVLDQSLGFSPDRGPTGTLEVVARPGAPEAPESPKSVAAPVIVDQKVGEINTRPVWAAEFLGPMAARMRQEAEDMRPSEWRHETRNRIVLVLTGRLRDELIVAATIADIPSAHRPGLSRVLEDVFRRERSAQRGSEALVERDLRGRDRTLSDEWQARREELLFEIRRERWRQQVHVSADEVDLEYHRLEKEFNPDPRAIFRRIRVPAADEEAVARIQQRLDDGEPFSAVAEDPANRNSPEQGGLVERIGTFTGEYTEAEFWAASELNEAARLLSEGEWTGPFATGSSANWLYLERIERKNVSLYDARPEIRRRLESARLQEIADADLAEMQSRASFTDIEVMAERLLAIAERWYLEPVLARRGESATPAERNRPRR